MRIRKKITLGLAITLGSIIIGTNVNAIETYQRTLTSSNWLLDSPVESSVSTGASQTAHKTFNRSDWWSTWQNGGTVNVSLNTLQNTPELLCIESETGLPSDREIAYRMVSNSIEKFGQGSSSYGALEDYKIAYILSEQIREGQTGELYTQDIQGALWRTRYNFNWSIRVETENPNLAGKELYNQAIAYAEYKSAYVEPNSVNAGELKTVNQNGSKIVGPLKIKYTMKSFNSTIFGNILSATLKDNNGIEHTYGTDWWFTDINGTEISNTVAGRIYKFPKSEETFYIKIRAGLNITRVNLSFEFNNINAKAESMILEGSYILPGKSEQVLHLCSDCSEKLKVAMKEADCGAYVNGVQYKGYKAYETASKVECRNKIFEIRRNDSTRVVKLYLYCSHIYICTNIYLYI